jgi:hypothetical protein
MMQSIRYIGQLQLTLVAKKKAVAFSIASILILVLLVSYVPTVYVTTPSGQAIRLETLDKFLQNIIVDAQFALYNAGYRSLISLVSDIENTGIPISDPYASLIELQQFGTSGGVTSTIMVNNTVYDWIQKIEVLADQFDVNLTITPTGLTVDQIDPWSVRCTIFLDIIARDRKTSASWNLTPTVTVFIPIDRFPDPLFIIGTANMYVRDIVKANATPVGPGQTQLHMQQARYIASDNAPSFLSRFSFDFTPSPVGIESIIDLQAMGTVVAVDLTRSRIDHVYFSPATPVVYSVISIHPTFKIDNETAVATSTLDRYGLGLYATP